MEVNDFAILLIYVTCHVLFLTCLKTGYLLYMYQ